MKIEIEISTESEKQYSEEKIQEARDLLSDSKLMELAKQPAKKGISSIQDIKDAGQEAVDTMECSAPGCANDAQCEVCDMCSSDCECNHKEEPESESEDVSEAIKPKTMGAHKK